jgi:2-C-methyl-D-erythritol 4-phosphate cytidylyltransferase
MKNKEVIIVAGGVGRRMESQIPKQFLRLGGEIILIRTIRLFYEYDPSCRIIITLPQSEITTWQKICEEENFTVTHQVVMGGKTRFHSVKNALEHVAGNGLIAVHDGVRPLVSRETIDKTFQEAELKGNAIPVTDIYESIRFQDQNKNYPVERDKYKIIQTPQVFKSEILLNAYQSEHKEQFTDDASVVEYMGEKIHLIHGNPENIKITTKKDLAVGETLLKFIKS